MGLTARALLVPPSPWRFPRGPEDAGSNGLVGIGADLEPSTLVWAYRAGVFPWPSSEDDPIPWHSPDPRGVVDLSVGPLVRRSLRTRLRSCGWTATVDAACDQVIERCQVAPRPGVTGGSGWITRGMRSAYTELHRLGWVHSVEVWAASSRDRASLIGGCYGVLVGRVFTGESMFYAVSDASKVAFIELCARMAAAGGAYVDVQMVTPHLATLGAVAMPRADWLARLGDLRNEECRMETDRLPVGRLV